MASYFFGQLFNRLYDTNFDSADIHFGPEPETLQEPPKPQQETLADASLWRLFCVFMTKFWEIILVVAENSPVSFFYGITIITTICLSVLLLYRLKKGRPTKEFMSLSTMHSTQQIKSINVRDPYPKGNTKSTQQLKLAPEKFRPGKNFNTWLFLFENYLKDIDKSEWLSCLWTMLDEKCLNDNSIDFTRSYEEIRAYLLEIYGEKNKTKSKSTATSARENVQ